MDADAVKAVVQKVVPEGEHGPFAVATSEGLSGSVTFSLEPTVWEEGEWPEEGTYVLLEKLRKKRAGWRAKTGRFFKPSDEQTERRREMKKQYLLLVDFEAGIAGIEDTVASGIHCWIRGTTDCAQPGQFREVSETLADCAAGKAIHGGRWSGEEKTRCEGGWNPQGFHGGSMTNSAIGLLVVVEGIFRRTIWQSDIGRVLELGDAEYVVRPCKADLMPIRLWERHEKPWRRVAAREETFGLTEARRLCFGARKNQLPKRVYFAKGTTSVELPEGAVARLGSSESSTVVFLDKFARPLAAYKAAGSWDSHYAQPIPIPERLEWRKLRPLGKSTADVLFGVHA